MALTGLPAAATPAVAAAERDRGARAVTAYLRFDCLMEASHLREEAIDDSLRPFEAAIEVRDDDPWSFNPVSRADPDGRRRHKLAHLSILRRVRNLPPEHDQRRQELVAALERYRDEGERLRNVMGLQEARKAAEDAREVSDGLFDELVGTPAATLAGIIAKAKAVKAIYPDAEPGEDGGTVDVRIAMSIVRDLLALDSVV